MGSTLDKIFTIVTKKAGCEGRMRLAKKTGIPRTKASEIEDTPETISRFKAVADEILGCDIDEFM